MSHTHWKWVRSLNNTRNRTFVRNVRIIYIKFEYQLHANSAEMCFTISHLTFSLGKYAFKFQWVLLLSFVPNSAEIQIKHIHDVRVSVQMLSFYSELKHLAFTPTTTTNEFKWILYCLLLPLRREVSIFVWKSRQSDSIRRKPRKHNTFTSISIKWVVDSVIALSFESNSCFYHHIYVHRP